MTNGIFKTWSNIGRAEWGHARAPEVMSTQSAVGFEWSLKLIDGSFGSLFYVGIASKLKLENSWIYNYDPNSILYSTHYRDIRVGTNSIHSHLRSHKDGDVIRFRFQPQTKKLLIDLVRVILF